MIQIESTKGIENWRDEKFRQLWHLVGNTPMLEIIYEYRGRQRTLYVKCEYFNFTGSIKDRMALYILQKAYAAGDIVPGNRIVEATSGNTGISFSALGKTFGHAVTIIMPDWLSSERTAIIKSFGAEVLPVSKQEGGFIGSLALAEYLSWTDPNVFLPKQFQNKYNSEAHQETTGPEIWQQLAGKGLKPDAFVAGVGTGGTVMGVGKYLKMKDTQIKVHPVEPAESPTLSTGFKTGSHRIQGISDEFIPAIVDLHQLDDIIPVNDGDAIIIAQKLARQLGIAAGISSGANILGAIKAQNQLGDEAVVVTVLPDSNKKYLSTDLVKEEPVKEHYLSNHINFLDYMPVKRIRQ